jgi:signal transduction histidine kinase
LALSSARLAGNALAAPPPAAPLVQVVAPAPQTELRAKLRAVLADVQDDADRLNVQLELAIPSRMILPNEPGALPPVLRAPLRNAVEHTPNGRVFIGAMRADACLWLSVIDDGKTAARPVAAELCKPLVRLLVEAGAGLVVDHRPRDGTTLVLSLPEAG